MVKKSNSRKIRRRISERLAKQLESQAQRRAAAADAAEPPAAAPKSGDTSFDKRPSERELNYNTKTAPEGTAFTDGRGRSYATGPGGQLRALNKPRSRVKRLREERTKKNQQEQKPTEG